MFKTTFLLERLLARLVADEKLVKADIPSILKQTAKAIEIDAGDRAWFVLESQIDLKT